MNAPLTDWFGHKEGSISILPRAYLFVNAQEKDGGDSTLIWKCSRKLYQDTFIYISNSVCLMMLKPIHIPSLDCSVLYIRKYNHKDVLAPLEFYLLEVEESTWRWASGRRTAINTAEEASQSIFTHTDTNMCTHNPQPTLTHIWLKLSSTHSHWPSGKETCCCFPQWSICLSALLIDNGKEVMRMCGCVCASKFVHQCGL